MFFESGVVPEDCRNAVAFPFYEGEVEMTVCKKPREILVCQELFEKFMLGH